MKRIPYRWLGLFAAILGSVFSVLSLARLRWESEIPVYIPHVLVLLGVGYAWRNRRSSRQVAIGAIVICAFSLVDWCVPLDRHGRSPVEMGHLCFVEPLKWIVGFAIFFIGLIGGENPSREGED
jgi:hypothetical protein